MKCKYFIIRLFYMVKKIFHMLRKRKSERKYSDILPLFKTDQNIGGNSCSYLFKQD